MSSICHPRGHLPPCQGRDMHLLWPSQSGNSPQRPTCLCQATRQGPLPLSSFPVELVSVLCITEVVKLNMLLSARQPSLPVTESWLPSPFIRGVFLEPLGLPAAGGPWFPGSSWLCSERQRACCARWPAAHQRWSAGGKATLQRGKLERLNQPGKEPSVDPSNSTLPSPWPCALT